MSYRSILPFQMKCVQRLFELQIVIICVRYIVLKIEIIPWNYFVFSKSIESWSQTRKWQMNWNWSNQNMQQLKRTVLFLFYSCILTYSNGRSEIFFNSLFFGLLKEFLCFVEFSSFWYLSIVCCFYSFIQKFVYRSFHKTKKKQQQNTRGTKFRSFVRGMKSFLWHKNLIEINNFVFCERRNWKKYKQ